jgi:hypothetical protein
VLELELEELDCWEVEVLENLPLESGPDRVPEVDTVKAGPWLKVPWKLVRTGGFSIMNLS